MTLYAPYGLSETIFTSVLVVGIAIFVLVNNDTQRISQNPSAIQIPVMPCVPALNGHIIIIHLDNIEIS